MQDGLVFLFLFEIEGGQITFGCQRMVDHADVLVLLLELGWHGHLFGVAAFSGLSNLPLFLVH